MFNWNKNKRLVEERIPTFPRREVYFDKKQLEAQGFPAEVSEAFLRTADDTNCVVMSRAPGGDKTGLIRQGYDLKGFLIKPKSCDWGPMAGFLCQIPALNKYGSAKIGYNFKNHKKYLEYRKKHNIPGSAYIPLVITKERKEEILKSAAEGKDRTSGYLEKNFFKELDEDTVIGLAFARDEDDAVHQSVLVEFLMVRTRKSGGRPELWSLYHGNILYCLKMKDENGAVILAEEGPHGGYFDLLNDPSPHLDGDGLDRKKMPVFLNDEVPLSKPLPTLAAVIAEGGNSSNTPGGAIGNSGDVEVRPIGEVLEGQSILGKEYAPSEIQPVQEYTVWLRELGIQKRPERSRFYPICGTQNPYPPYGQDQPKEKKDKRSFVSGVEDSYKNAVTGDFDLFAIWPVKPPVGWEMLVRLAEQQVKWENREKEWKQGADNLQEQGGAPRTESFFLENAGKPYSLELRASPDVFVEVIPGFSEIEQWESEELGNINNATALVASSLNDTVSIAAEKSGGLGAARVSPNMAFHNDEGGRPGIDDVDYPFAVFLPKALFEQLKKDLNDRKSLDKATREALTPKTRMLLIDKPRHDDFLDLACMLREKCYLLFNHVWLMQMFALISSKAKLSAPGIDTTGEKKPEKIKKDREKYFKARLDELDELTKFEQQDKLGMTAEAMVEKIKKRLSELFIGSQLRINHPNSEVAAKEKTAAIESLNNLAAAFMEVAAKDHGGKATVREMMSRLKKAMITIPNRGEQAKIPNPPGAVNAP